MQLEQEGLLNIEDFVCLYIDECPPGWDAITLHHLLSHTLTSKRRVVEHGGRVPGFGARLRRFVDEDVTVVVLANRLDAEPGRAAAGLGAVAFGEPHESVFDRKAIRLSAQARGRFLGDYELNGQVYTLFERDGNLFVRGEGTQEIPLPAESETVLFIQGVSGSVEAVEDRSGKITALHASFGRTLMVARKVR